jgi:transcriptional regulator with XRE-family HTH domain
MDIGKALKSVRTSKGLTQAQLADKMGYSVTFVCNIENGDRKPSMEFLDRLVYATKVPLFAIFWYAITEEDVSYEKRDKYNMAKEAVESLIKKFI